MRHALTAIMAAASLSSAASAQVDPVTPPPQSEIAAAIAKDMDGLMALYRDLHAHPELSGQEIETAAKLARRLKAMQFDVTEKVGG
ncbi:MAG TPA: amidohydrolase, partial [Sphingobium sp.]